MAQDFQELNVWNRAMELTETVYELTKLFPPDERFGLTSQLRRACVSIASNIAEGRGRGSDRDFRHFLNIAQGSTFEVRTQLLLAIRLKIGPDAELHKAELLCVEVSRMLAAFIQSLTPQP